MKQIPAAFVLSFLTIGSAMASPGGLTDTRSLGQLCREDVTASTMYVMGVAEMALATKTAKFCVKRGYTMKQARDRVCDYISTEAAPELMPLSAAVVTNEILSHEWTCD